ncbi:hypothetical protein [Saccharopolyspora elongata]|uniref:Uncharacterized protein n=1 Tax=Saccharopolyspora elongata TaxID=2530387 RepID=A0A4R4YHD1_9PSEU|nr:hypothetical protein [Saccharopolyspora elongata]TDD44278.1 hypothetical protein E1288_24465 [Saccharopolyspora elongata]
MPLVIVVELALLFSGVLGIGAGVLVVAVVEGSLLVLVAVEAWLVWRAVRRARARGAGGTDPLASSLRAVMPDWAASVVRHDLLMIRALWLAVRRRQDVPEDGEAIHYSRQLRPMMWVFFVLNPLEVVLVELAVPWQTLRIVLAVIGILSTIWFLALLATMYKYPHSIDPRVLRLRYCSFFDFQVPVGDIDSVVVAKHTRGMKRSSEAVEGTLILEVSRTTNISISLRREHDVDLGLRGTGTVCAVDFWADDPRTHRRTHPIPASLIPSSSKAECRYPIHHAVFAARSKLSPK